MRTHPTRSSTARSISARSRSSSLRWASIPIRVSRASPSKLRRTPEEHVSPFSVLASRRAKTVRLRTRGDLQSRESRLGRRGAAKSRLEQALAVLGRAGRGPLGLRERLVHSAGLGQRLRSNCAEQGLPGLEAGRAPGRDPPIELIEALFDLAVADVGPAKRDLGEGDELGKAHRAGEGHAARRPFARGRRVIAQHRDDEIGQHGEADRVRLPQRLGERGGVARMSGALLRSPVIAQAMAR